MYSPDSLVVTWTVVPFALVGYRDGGIGDRGAGSVGDLPIDGPVYDLSLDGAGQPKLHPIAITNSTYPKTLSPLCSITPPNG